MTVKPVCAEEDLRAAYASREHGVGVEEQKSLGPGFSFRLNSRLPALDGLRGFAILAVLIYHYAGGLTRQSGGTAISWAASLIGMGWTGVDLFFVLSGFLITGILYDSRKTPRYFSNFYMRRALRIFPAFYLLVAIYLVLSPYLHVQWRGAHLFFLIYLGYPAALIWPVLESTGPLPLVHSWSLCAEEQFYLVWPWIVARARKVKSLVLTSLGLGLIAILLRIAVISSHSLQASWAHGFLLCRLDALAFGAILALLARTHLYIHLRRWSTAVFIVSTAGFLTICLLRRSVDMYDSLIATLGYSLVAIGYGSLLIGCLEAGMWPYRFFSGRVLRLFGKYSYGMYLYHLPIAGLIHPAKEILVRQTKSSVAGGVAYLFAAIAINLLIACISFHLFENPILRVKSRFQS